MRRMTRLVAVLGLLIAAVMFGAAGASAAPGRPLASVGSCPDNSAYPVTTPAEILASTTTPFIGQVIEVSGINYCANEDVKIYLRGVYMETTHTDALGAFDPPLKVTGPVGPAELSGIGASGLPGDQDSLILQVRGPNGVEATTASRGNGGLPFTGTQTALLLALAALLLGIGGATLYAGRRKKGASHA